MRMNLNGKAPRGRTLIMKSAAAGDVLVSSAAGRRVFPTRLLLRASATSGAITNDPYNYHPFSNMQRSTHVHEADTFSVEIQSELINCEWQILYVFRSKATLNINMVWCDMLGILTWRATPQKGRAVSFWTSRRHIFYLPPTQHVEIRPHWMIDKI